jgi:hypothetical protein
MKKEKVFLGTFLISIAGYTAIRSPVFTGSVIGERSFYSLGVFVLFILGIMLLVSGGLEKTLESKASFGTRLRRSLAARAVGATILAGAGAYGGHKAGEALQPYAKPIERAYQVTELVGRGIIPGSSEFNAAVAKKYLGEIGKEGQTYLSNRKSKDNKAYNRELEESLKLLQESAGNLTHKATEKVEGVREAQGVKDKIYSGVGKIFGAREIEKRSSESYSQNYDALAMRKINALIRLSQVNGQIDETLNSLSMQAAKPSENKEATTYLRELSGEANQIYDFLGKNHDLSIDQIYAGERDANYSSARELGGKIKGADYPLTDNLPYAGAVAGAAVGAYIGARRRRVGDTVIATGKYAGKAGRAAMPYAAKGAQYIGKKARQVRERIASRRKIK